MHIVHVIAGCFVQDGGPAEVVPQLCVALVKEGCTVSLLTVDGEHSAALTLASREGVDVRSFPMPSMPSIRYSNALSKEIRQLFPSCDVVHQHGIWMYPNWITGYWANRFKKPLVITPHGVLVSGMLAIKRKKKMIAWNTFVGRLVKSASAIHALSGQERNEMSSMVEEKRTFVIPNGVEIEDFPSSMFLEQRYPELRGKKVLLFLSRIHPIKGVRDLLAVWKRKRENFQDWHLLLVGQVVASLEQELNAISLLGPDKTGITVAGPIYGADKKKVYAAADAFVLPSYGEGLPTVLLEAMSAKLPIIYTSACNLPNDAYGGYSGPPGEEALEQNLECLLLQSDASLHRLGLINRKIVEKKYNWSLVARKMKGVYESLI